MLYRVCLLTGDDGQDGSSLFTDKKLLGHIYVGPYLHFEPELSLSLVNDEDIPVGYCLATTNTSRFFELVKREWIPKIKNEYKDKDKSVWKPKDFELWEEIEQLNYKSHKELVPYPAHLHIDLLEVARGKGWGRTLVDKQLSQLKENGVTGVHLEMKPRNINAKNFYEHLGFRLLPNNAGRNDRQCLIMAQIIIDNL